MQYSTLNSSTAVEYNSWHLGAGIAWTGKKSYWLTGEGRGGGRWWSWRTVNNRSQRTSCNVTQAWHGWNTHWELWKFEPWRFVCRGLTVQGLLHVLILLSRFPPLYTSCSNQSPRNHSLFPYPNTQFISNSVFEFLQMTSSSPPFLTPKSKALSFAGTNAAAWQSGPWFPRYHSLHSSQNHLLQPNTLPWFLRIGSSKPLTMSQGPAHPSNLNYRGWQHQYTKRFATSGPLTVLWPPSPQAHL